MTCGKPMRVIFLGAATFAAASFFPADAAEDSRGLADALALEAPSWEFDNTTIRLGGVAAGALFSELSIFATAAFRRPVWYSKTPE